MDNTVSLDKSPVSADRTVIRGGVWIAALFVASIFSAWVVFPELRVLSYQASGDGARLISDTRVQSVTSGNLSRILIEGYWGGYSEPLYRPFTTLSFYLGNAAARLIGQPAPGVQIGINLLTHWACICLLARLLTKVTRRMDIGIVAALLWGCHAGHLEALVGIAGRADILSLLAGLGGCLLWLNCRFYKGFALLCVAALSKESGAFFFAVPLLTEFSMASPAKRLRLAGWALASGVTLVCVLQLWRHSLTPGYFIPFGDNPLSTLSFLERVPLAAQILFDNTISWVFGQEILTDYSYGSNYVAGLMAEPRVGLRGVFLICLLGSLAAVSLWRIYTKAGYAPWAILWFMGAIFPVSNLVIPIGATWGSRLLYSPSVGIFVLVATALVMISDKTREDKRCWSVGIVNKKVTIFLVSTMVALNLFAIIEHSPSWANNGIYSIATNDRSDGSYRFGLASGQVYLDIHDKVGGPSMVDNALTEGLMVSSLWDNSGTALWQRDGRGDILVGDSKVRLALRDQSNGHALLLEAAVHYRKAIAVADAKRLKRIRHDIEGPWDVPHSSYLPSVRSLVKVLLQTSQLAEAQSVLKKSLKIVPYDPDTHSVLSYLYGIEGDAERQRDHNIQAVIFKGLGAALTGDELESASRTLKRLQLKYSKDGYVRTRERLKIIDAQLLGGAQAAR